MQHEKDMLVPSTLSCSNHCINPLMLTRIDIWFHRYDKDGKDIEGRYGSLVAEQTASNLLIRIQICRRLQLVARVMGRPMSCITLA